MKVAKYLYFLINRIIHEKGQIKKSKSKILYKKNTVPITDTVKKDIIFLKFI